MSAETTKPNGVVAQPTWLHRTQALELAVQLYAQVNVPLDAVAQRGGYGANVIATAEKFRAYIQDGTVPPCTPPSTH